MSEVRNTTTFEWIVRVLVAVGSALLGVISQN